MSMTLIFGNFSVFGAEISQIGKNQHVVYKTSVHTDDGWEYFPAYIWTFLPGGSTPLEDNTTVFLYGKLCASCRSPFLIEVINMFCYPGDPTDPFHGAGPSFGPQVSILGHVQNSTDIPTYEGHCVFTLLSSAWVWVQLQASAFMAFFDGSPRWKKLTVPNKNSCVNTITPSALAETTDSTTQLQLTGHEQACKTQPERPKTSHPVSTLPLEQIRSPDDINPATPHPWNPEPNEPNQRPLPDASSVPVLSHSKYITSTESEALTTPPPTNMWDKGNKEDQS
ncbi:hypothetical protein M422DRAFT_245406 [Sphaerobolus stellatus SS14]|nr:hypothetical protein M422DRAFT_245406 [Sphaerobolus stellatus SS14]